MDNIVSIIIPVYNCQDFLDLCIKSVIHQSYKDLQIILVNDGSTDNSYKICKKYADIDSRILLINKENTGVSDTRNEGIRAATGQYIVFIDSDDFVSERLIDTLIKTIEHDKSDLVLCGRYFFSQNKSGKFIYEREIKYSRSQIDEKLFDRFFSYSGSTGPMCKIYKKSIIDRNEIFFPSNLRMFEDGIFNSNYIKNCRNVSLISEQLYFHRISINSLSKRNSSELISMFENMNEILSNDTLSKQFFLEGMLKTIVYKYYNCYGSALKFTCKERKTKLRELMDNTIVREFVQSQRTHLDKLIYKNSIISLDVFAYKFRLKRFVSECRAKLKWKMTDQSDFYVQIRNIVNSEDQNKG